MMLCPRYSLQPTRECCSKKGSSYVWVHSFRSWLQQHVVEAGWEMLTSYSCEDYFSNLERHCGLASLAAPVQIGVSILLSWRREGVGISFGSNPRHLLFLLSFSRFFFFLENISLFSVGFGTIYRDFKWLFFKKNNFLQFFQGAIPQNPHAIMPKLDLPIFLVIFVVHHLIHS